MARTIYRFNYTRDFAFAKNNIEAILVQNGFTLKNVNNEIVWKKGKGLLTAMQYVKVEYAERDCTVSGWVQIGLGSIGGNEMDLKGFTGAVPKKMLKNIIEHIGKNI